MSNLRALDHDQELRPAWLTSQLFPFTSRFVDVDDFRCIALDFPGFGLSPSDARYPPTMPALSHVVERFIDQLELRDIILVVGDVGGPIGLGVAARHPEWFAGLVLAGTFGWSLKDYPKVRRMLGIVSSPIFGFLQERSNFLMKYTARTFPRSGRSSRRFLRRMPARLRGEIRAPSWVTWQATMPT